MAVNFRLFNCDRTFNLDKVEALIQRVAKKISREVKIEKTYFPLPRMKELCEELEKGDGSHFEYAVFVVHAHESRLSINEKNAGIGYAKVYRALQKVTGDQVLVVIGGDDNYKGQEERDKSVLSRWAWLKICSQFTEDYVNGMKGFIFSWEENHHPIHEEALEFYLDPRKKGTKFEPRPRPPPVKAPEKKETTKTEQAKLLETKRQEAQRMEAKKLLEKKQPYQDPLLSEQKPKSTDNQSLEKDFPPKKGRELPPEPGDQKMRREAQPSQQQATQSYPSKPIETVQTSNRTDVLVMSFYSKKESVSGVQHLISNLCSVRNPYWNPNSLPQEILKNKPGCVLLVSDFKEFRDLFSSPANQNIYHDILKNSKAAGTKLIFIITEDTDYREGELCSNTVNRIFTGLNQGILIPEQPTIMSWNKTSWPTHKDALVQLLTSDDNWAAPQKYGATIQGTTSRVPYTQSANVPMKRRSYKASISYGRVVKVLERDPPDWLPDSRLLNRLLMDHENVKKTIVEFWDEGDGRLQGTFHPNEAKLCKIAEGIATGRMHSILVYSYLEEVNSELKKLIHPLGISELSPCQPIDPVSLMEDITCTKPDYMMFCADIEVLKDEGLVKTVMREYATKIKEIIENNVGKGVIIMLFGDKLCTYKKGKLASDEATKKVRKLTQGIVPPDRLIVMTCQDRPYTTHLDRMKELLKSKTMTSVESRDPEKGLLRYRASVKFGSIVQVEYRSPQDWQPEEFMLKDMLERSRKQEKGMLEFWEGSNGQINPIAITMSDSWLSFPSLPNLFSSKEKKAIGKSDVV